jgi:hypothetical protein
VITATQIGRTLGAFLTVGVLLAAPAPAAAQATQGGSTHTDAPFTMTVLNSCTNEMVDVTGIVTTTALSKFDASGGLHISFAMVSKGTGVGQVTGTQYPYSENDLASVNAGSATTFTFRVKARLRGPGRIDDWELTFMNHITMNADGSITSEIEKDATSCRG